MKRALSWVAAGRVAAYRAVDLNIINLGCCTKACAPLISNNSSATIHSTLRIPDAPILMLRVIAGVACGARDALCVTNLLF